MTYINKKKVKFNKKKVKFNFKIVKFNLKLFIIFEKNIVWVYAVEKNVNYAFCPAESESEVSYCRSAPKIPDNLKKRI